MNLPEINPQIGLITSIPYNNKNDLKYIFGDRKPGFHPIPKDNEDDQRLLRCYMRAAQKGNESPRRIDRNQYDINLPKEQGVFIAYIFSFEMLNTVLANTKGHPYGDAKKIQIVKAMHSNNNLEIKRSQVYEGFSSDMKSDIVIMNAINSKNENGKKMEAKQFEYRLLAIFDVVQVIDLPEELKQQIKKHFSQIKKKNGKDIIK